MPTETSAVERLTSAHYSRLRFYWQHRGRAPNQASALEHDLLLCGFLAWKETQYSGGTYVVTEAGAEALAHRTNAIRERRAPHQELANRLAQHLRDKGRVTWNGIEFVVRETDITKKAAALGLDVPELGGLLYAAPRPDVYSIVATRNDARLNPVVHEVKVSRADFLADVAKPAKRLAYACIAESVVYVAPQGIIEPEDVPNGCGLLVEVEAGTFKLVKRAKRLSVQLSASHYLNLVLKPGVLPRDIESGLSTQ